MRQFIILFLCSALLVAIGCRPAASPVAIDNRPVSVNGVPVRNAPSQPLKPVPEMGWTGFEGNVQKIKDLHGKVVILDFWATYCPPCIEEIPHLMQLESKYGPDDLVVIGLHVGGEEDQPKVPDFVKRLKITYPLGYPEEALTAYIFGQDSAIPQTAVFDRNGNLVKKITGFSPEIKQELDQTVDTAIRQ